MLLRLSLTAFLALITAYPAHALFNISSAKITEGELAVESRNRFDHDEENASRDGYRAHAVDVQYSPSRWLALELQGRWEERHLNDYEFASTEPEIEVRFYEPGAYWLESAAKFSYEISHVDGVADRAKAKLLLEKAYRGWEALVNLNLSRETGSDATRDTTFDAAWRLRRDLKDYPDLGIEAYTNWGEISRTGDYESQRHRIGPMFFGEIVPGVKYQFGYLFGISDAAEDGSLKLFLKYEIPL